MPIHRDPFSISPHKSQEPPPATEPRAGTCSGHRGTLTLPWVPRRVLIPMEPGSRLLSHLPSRCRPSRCKTTVYLPVGISERGCDRISLHVPQGTFLHFSTVNPVLTPSPGIHIGLRILMPLTPGSASITPVLNRRMGCFGRHHRDDKDNTRRAVQ